VHLHGVLEGGGSFLVRDDRDRPRFWIPRADVERALGLGAGVADERPDRVSLEGEPVARVEVAVPADARALRERLHGAGIRTFEADVRFAYRYLIDRGIRGAVDIEGPSRPRDGITAVFERPELRPASFTPSLSVLSVDIETDPGGRRLLSIALHGCGASEVLLLAESGASCPAPARPFPGERELLAGFVRRMVELDPDVVTGWNVVDFDFAFLLRAGERQRVPLAIGRGEPSFARFASYGGFGRKVEIPGRLLLDGVQLLRNSFVRIESHSLQSVAMRFLGRGKTITGSDRAQRILDAFVGDRPRFVEYNLNDAVLVIELLERLRLVDLAVERSLLTGMPPDRVAASIAAFDFLYLSELSRRRVVAPTTPPVGSEPIATAGGHVLDPLPGLYRNVVVLDFRSLYPSVIRTFQIDPAGYLPLPTVDDDPIVAPNGAAFRREPGILPGILDDLFPRRAQAIREGNAVASQAIKILMNSFYGVLGTPACRFASPELANAITGFGREILLWTRDRIERRGLRVLYGDTDSLFVLSDAPSPDEADELGRRLSHELTAELAVWVRERWHVESKLELQLDRVFARLLLPAVRHGTAGARKRYAGLVVENGSPRVTFTGMEVVRTDWTRLAREVQRELYERLFSDRPVEDYLSDVVRRLRAGELDELLVYRKRLRKELRDYTSATPPHVVAARKGQAARGSFVSYLVTTAGAEPAGEAVSPIDHEHYVQKQVRPVAEPVLAILGLDFDRVIGDDRQLRLF
jgi:DNA polymerase-2